MATQSQVLRYLTFTSTQGGADTFAQSTIPTGIIPADGYAFKVKSIELEKSADTAIASDCSFHWSLTRDTKTAAATLADVDTMFVDGYAVALTTSGEIIVPIMHRYEFPEGLFIVEPNIYFQNVSAGSGQTNTVYGRIYYEDVKLTEVEILRLLNNA